LISFLLGSFVGFFVGWIAAAQIMRYLHNRSRPRSFGVRKR
jgi:hypothetical protein